MFPGIIKKHRYIALGVIIVLILIAGFAIKGNKLRIAGNSIAQHFIPVYRSIRKLPDVFYSWAFLHRTNLPIYSVHLTKTDIQNLNASLPSNPFGSESLNTVGRVYVNATFQSEDGYIATVKVRYRGSLSNNWNSLKKSFLIQFPRSNLFHGMSELSLYLPDDRLYMAEPLNTYRAKKLGLLSPDISLIRLKINGTDSGVYLASEHWSQEWVEKNPVAPKSNIIGIRQVPFTSSKLGFAWKSWNQDSADESVLLTELVDHATQAEFERYAPLILDLDAFYKRDIVNILSGGYHNDSYWSPENSRDPGDSNMILSFDGTVGKFIPIPYNTAMYPNPGLILEEPSYLTKRIRSISSFRQERDRLLKTYLDYGKNIQDDVDFIDSWVKDYKIEFYSDYAKIDPSYKVSKDIDAIAASLKKNIELASAELTRVYEYAIYPTGKFVIPKEYKIIQEAGRTPWDFVSSNPMFTLTSKSITLPVGSYIFTEDVVVPAGSRLMIEPGTHVYMATDKVFVSYSPVTAKGTQYAPITFEPTGDKSWGNFAVIDTGHFMNYFHYVNFRMGSTTIINKTPVHGMLTFARSDADVQYSSFEDARGDDALHSMQAVLTASNNTFINNSSDSIDIDVGLAGTNIKNNIFINTNKNKKSDGDAIDLSWTKAIIADNKIFGSNDKGLSVGEHSDAIISGNVFANCFVGIATKNSSISTVESNIFAKNKTVFELYQKSPLFGGGTATVKNNKLISNNTERTVDKLSKINYTYNTTITKKELKKLILPSDFDQIFP